MNVLDSGRRIARALRLPPVTKPGKFLRVFNQNLAACDWEPHPQYSVFTQWDKSFYHAHKEAFLHKYRCFWAFSKTITPRSMIEIGTAAGSGADAYLSASPQTEYLGLDLFITPPDEETGEPWDPRGTCEKLLRARGFAHWELMRVDLRALRELPRKADLVVVDAAHDFENEYADLNLALTADPRWIWVDDVEAGCEEAVRRFLDENRARVDFTAHVEYIGGGGVAIRLNK